ncbi:MAG: chromosomal replication initiator protein DnaA, partial [Alphaproteobacteria bacterium]|nr:chromosomal replication initiator protein DnaA [Alphaproteobacteria bacterium]
MTDRRKPYEAPGEGAPDPVDLDSELRLSWESVRGKLKSEFGDKTFNSWLRPVELVGATPSGLALGVPTRFMRDWVRAHYLSRIQDLWKAELGVLPEIELKVELRGAGKTCAPETAGEPAAPSASATPVASDRPRPHQLDTTSRQMDLTAPLDPRFTFDSFVVGKSNELAHAAAHRVASETKVQFNPLFLYGGVGLGKTHLMHAIAWEIRRRHPQRKVIYMSAEKFMYQFIRALRFKDTMSFKDEFRSVDVLMIDDVQFIAHKDATQEEFFHTFNALVDHNRQVVISADRSPSDLDGIEERIRSRLGWGLVADIHPTDYELRLGILQSKREQLGDIEAPDEVIEFLARRISSNVRELEGYLIRIGAFASLTSTPISLEMAKNILKDIIVEKTKEVTVENIQKTVANHFQLKTAELKSAQRLKTLVQPRQIAMYICRKLTSASYPEI